MFQIIGGLRLKYHKSKYWQKITYKKKNIFLKKQIKICFR